MKHILFLILFTSYLLASTIQDAKELFDTKHDYKKAIEIFLQYPNDGEAQYYIGKAYWAGLGVDKNETKTFEYAKKSADQNNPNGLNLLGILYKDGVGVKKDKVESLIYFRISAKLGSTKAMINLANAYDSGNSLVEQNDKKAIYWYKKAAINGYYDGYNYIGNIYYFNVKNYDKALINYFNYLQHNKHYVVLFQIGRIYYELNKIDLAYQYYRDSSAMSYSIGAILGLINLEKKYPRKFPNKIGLNLLKKAANSKFNKTSSLKLFQFSLFYYYVESNQVDKAIKLADKLYKNENNIRMGCQLAFYYSNNPSFKLDLEKSYKIATKIINENNATPDTSSCYDALSYMYLTGFYLAKDMNKSIELKIKDFNLDKINYIRAEGVANTYLKDLKDYKNARKWYKTAYDLSKDKKYLTIVDDYIKNQPKFEDKKITKKEQKLYPIVGPFNNPKQAFTWIETNKYYFIATSLKDIRMYDKNTLKLLKIFRGWISDGINGITFAMAFDEKNSLLYCTGINSTTNHLKNDIIKVFDIKSDKIINTINNKHSFKSNYLELSNDGKYLVSINQGHNLNIINTQTNKIQFYSFNSREIFIKAKIVKEDDDYIVKVLSRNNNLYSFSVNKARQIKKENYLNQVDFRTFNGKKAENIFKIKQKYSKDKKAILKNISNEFNIKLMVSNNKKQLPNTTANILKNGRVIEVYKDNKLLFNIDTLQPRQVRILNYKVLDNKYIVILFSDIILSGIYDLKGNQLVKFITNYPQDNIIYQDKQLITYGKDNIFNIWDISNIDKYKLKDNEYDMDIVKSFSKMSRGNPLNDLTNKYTYEDLKDFSTYMKLDFIATEHQIKSFWKMLFLKKYPLNPIASLYIQDNDWIIYNHKGYFASSKNGAKLIKYHLNQGLNKEAKIVENKQLFDKFYRPDLIKKVLNGEKVNFDMDIKSIIKNTKPPKLSILKSKLKDDKNLDLTYQICDMGSGVSNTNLIINDIAINLQTTRGFTIDTIKDEDKNCKVYKNTITLNPGENKLFIKSYDKDKLISVTSPEITINANYKVAKKVNLHLLTMAVSNYRDNTLNLKYPVIDVKAISKTFNEKSKKLFDKIYTYELHDKNVTKQKLDAVFDKVSKNTDVNDVFVFYIAGHGVTGLKDGLYYFLPYDITDTSSKGLQDYAISINDLKYQLGKIKANKSLIMLDTCSSGGALDNITRGLNERMALERLSYATGRNYIVASSKDQVALEGYKNHGVFTYSVLDAFKNAYFGDDRTLTITSLSSYVEKKVPMITNEKFHYEQFPQKYLNGNDFPIGVK